LRITKLKRKAQMSPHPEYDARTDRMLSAIRSLDTDIELEITEAEAIDVAEYLNDGTKVEARNNDSLIATFEDGEKRYYRVFAEVTAYELTKEEFFMTPEELRERAKVNTEARTALIKRLLAEYKQQKGIS
jgi:hypothetical protein